MTTNEERCVGCGDSAQPGLRLVLANNNVLLITWREIFREKFNELNLEIYEDDLLGLYDGSTAKGFICRRCKRGFESYNSAKKKLLDSASNALKYITTTPRQQSRRRQRQDSEDTDADMPNPPAAKRKLLPMANVSGHSPNVQVSDYFI